MSLNCFGKKKAVEKKEDKEKKENKAEESSSSNLAASTRASKCGGEHFCTPTAVAASGILLEGNSSSTHSASTFDDLSNHGRGSSSFSDLPSSVPTQQDEKLSAEEGLNFSSSFVAEAGGEEEEEGGGKEGVAEEEDKVKVAASRQAFRTAALTAASAQSPVSAGTTAFRCYRCPTGLLVSSPSKAEESKEADAEAKKEEPNSFSCVDCGYCFPQGLSFIIRLVGEQTADAAYWQAEHCRRRRRDDSPRDFAHESTALDMWRQSLRQMRKLLPDASLRLVTAELVLAKAYYDLSLEEQEKKEESVSSSGDGETSSSSSSPPLASAKAARQLLASALEPLLFAYEPLEAVGEKDALLQAMTSAQKMMEEGQQQLQQLKAKIGRLQAMLKEVEEK